MQCNMHLRSDVRPRGGKMIHSERNIEDMLVRVFGRRPVLREREDRGVRYAVEEVEESRRLFYCHRFSAKI